MAVPPGIHPWLVLVLVTSCALLLQISAAADDAIISRLPGQPKINFRQHSGYITVDEKFERSYFYYFAEAENQPASKPLVLWLNGGPGCSSVGLGAFTENGPFRPRGNILVRNQYSWNKVANMLYLESPAGVGFSYSTNKSFYESVNDEMTARDNFNFIMNWLEKFPEYNNRDFFITGESYEGHYAPQLADLILRNKPKYIKLKGISMGNPLLEFNTDYNSGAEFLWSHGLISDSTFDLLNSVCNYSQIKRQTFAGKLTPECTRVKNQLRSEIGKYTDIYDVTLDVCLASASKQFQQDNPKIDVCVVNETKVYLTRKDVQKALHARLVGVSNWTICTTVMHYEMQNQEISTVGLLGSLVKRGIYVLAYSGDQDSLLPLSGTRKLINGLAKELKLKTTDQYRAWIVNNQVAGWTQGYGKYLSFATMRGASHDAPTSQPERALVLFTSFISGKPLPLPLV